MRCCRPLPAILRERAVSRLKLPEFLNKRGVTAAFSLFIAFSIIVTGTYSWVSLAHKASNEFEYEPTEAPLYITKTVSGKDINGNVFDATEYSTYAKDILFPFEFTVTLGDGADSYKEYHYSIVDADGNPITDYDYIVDAYGNYLRDYDALADGEARITQNSTGLLTAQNNKLYLQHGQTAIVEKIAAGTYYLVEEKQYIGDYAYLNDFLTDEHFEFGCVDDSDGGYKHNAIATLPNGGWVCFADRSEGYIAEEGAFSFPSTAAFLNVRVPVNYEVTISSLVVIDRIVEDDETLDHRRGQAGPEIIDHSQAFPVEVIVGENEKQNYYYEVVHIEATDRVMKDHEEKDDYYIVNDPHSEWHLTISTRLLSILQSGALRLDTLWSGLLNILPLTPRADGYIAPLHKPSDYERRLSESNSYTDGILTESKGNRIEVELHHQSALIIYGIPTTTPYWVKQMEIENGIYSLHSYYQRVGAIWPDLDAVPDPNYDEYKEFSGMARFDDGSDTPDLWRTRADIFNHPPQGARTIQVEKVWKGGTNRPNVKLDIINTSTNKTVKTVTLSQNNWKASVKVPLYNEDGSLSQYRVEEQNVRGYVASVTGNADNDSFVVTNTYYTGTSEESSEPTDEKAKLTVTKTVKGATGMERYKRFDFTVTIDRYKYKISLADGEKYTFTDIPVGTRYSVTEANYAQEGYATTSTGAGGTIVPSGNTAAFVNTKDVPAEGSGSLTVTKIIAGQFVDTTKQFRFIAQIGQKKHTFMLRHGESKTFADIPAGTAYQVAEDDYSAESYSTTAKNATGTVTADGVTAVFVNEYTGDSLPVPEGAVQISGTKIWDHGTNTEHPESIQVFVMNGSDIATRKTVTARENWKYTFNLPKYAADGTEITYSINEEPIKKYIKSVNGYDITNTYDPSQNPGTGGGRVMWIWFIVLLAGSLGLRAAVFYRSKRKGTL